MNEKDENIISANLMVVVGIGLALLYWFVESLLYVFSHSQGFFQQLFRPDLISLYRRLLVFSIFLIFGSHAQAIIKKQKDAEEDLRDYNKRLEQELKKKL